MSKQKFFMSDWMIQFLYYSETYKKLLKILSFDFYYMCYLFQIKFCIHIYLDTVSVLTKCSTAFNISITVNVYTLAHITMYKKVVVVEPNIAHYFSYFFYYYLS